MQAYFSKAMGEREARLTQQNEERAQQEELRRKNVEQEVIQLKANHVRTKVEVTMWGLIVRCRPKPNWSSQRESASSGKQKMYVEFHSCCLSQHNRRTEPPAGWRHCVNGR